MVLVRLALAFRDRLLSARESCGQELRSPAQIRMALLRERARADRTGDDLCVITFSWYPRELGRAALAALTRTLQGRLRITDEIGWLDERKICAVLPGATGEGAWKVADEVCALLPEEVPPLVGTVYSHSPYQGSGEEPSAALRPGPASTKEVLSLESFLLQRIPLWKRGLDVAGAVAGLVVLLPVFALIALAIRLTSEGPVLFRQWRSGRGGKPFLMYKFRTMAIDAEARKTGLLALNERDGPAFKIRKDPRVTVLGRLLRATCLDELPQLWNVLKGDMSLVGPRPLPCHEAAACSPWQRRRLDVTPGLTCIWQVRRTFKARFADWVRMDLEYIRSQSLLLDLKLLARTLPAMLRCKEGE